MLPQQNDNGHLFHLNKPQDKTDFLNLTQSRSGSKQYTLIQLESLTSTLHFCHFADCSNVLLMAVRDSEEIAVNRFVSGAHCSLMKVKECHLEVVIGIFRSDDVNNVSVFVSSLMECGVECQLVEPMKTRHTVELTEQKIVSQLLKHELKDHVAKKKKLPPYILISDRAMVDFIKKHIKETPNGHQYLDYYKNLLDDVDNLRFYNSDNLVYYFPDSNTYHKVAANHIAIFTTAFKYRLNGIKFMEIERLNKSLTVPDLDMGLTQEKRWVKALDDCEKIRKFLGAVMEELNQGLVGLEVPIKVAILSLLSQQNILLLGPPGVGKTEISKRILGLFSSGKLFYKEMTRFTTPEEMFGPISVTSLKDDEMKRNTTNYLPEATIAFLDEIFKSNSAILNSLLTIMNEKTFTNGPFQMNVPLLLLIAASNEMPDELEALYDRFLFRYTITPLNKDQCKLMLELLDRKKAPVAYTFFNWESVKLFGKLASKKVVVSKDVMELFVDIKELVSDYVIISSRRLCHYYNVLRTCAYANGRSKVSVVDLMVLKYMMNPDVEKMAQISAILIDCISTHINSEDDLTILNDHHFIQDDDKNLIVSQCLKQQ